MKNVSTKIERHVLPSPVVILPLPARRDGARPTYGPTKSFAYFPRDTFLFTIVDPAP